MESIRFETYPLLLLKTISAESSVELAKTNTRSIYEHVYIKWSCCVWMLLVFLSDHFWDCIQDILHFTITTGNCTKYILESWLHVFFSLLSHSLQMHTNYSCKPHKYHLTHIHESIESILHHHKAHKQLSSSCEQLPGNHHKSAHAVPTSASESLFVCSFSHRFNVVSFTFERNARNNSNGLPNQPRRSVQKQIAQSFHFEIWNFNRKINSHGWKCISRKRIENGFVLALLFMNVNIIIFLLHDLNFKHNKYQYIRLKYRKFKQQSQLKFNTIP